MLPNRKQFELKVKRLWHEVAAQFPLASNCLGHSTTLLIIPITFQNYPRPINATPFQLSNQFNTQSTISHPSVTAERQYKLISSLSL